MQGAVSMAPILGPVSQQEQVLLIRESMMSLSGEATIWLPLPAGHFRALHSGSVGLGQSLLGSASLQWRAPAAAPIIMVCSGCVLPPCASLLVILN